MCKWLINFSPTQAKDRLSSIYPPVPKLVFDAATQSVLEAGLEQFHPLKPSLRKFGFSHIPPAGLYAYFILTVFLT